MKQLEVNFSGILSKPKQEENIPTGWKVESKPKLRKRLTRKQLASINMQMTEFLQPPLSARGMEDDINVMVATRVDEATLDRMMMVAIKDREWRNSRMVTALLRDIVNEVPGRVEVKESVNIVVEAAWSSMVQRGRPGRK